MYIEMIEIKFFRDVKFFIFIFYMWFNDYFIYKMNVFLLCLNKKLYGNMKGRRKLFLILFLFLIYYSRYLRLNLYSFVFYG